MDDLGNDARGLLEAFRADERPSDARRDAIWSELEASNAASRPRRKIPPMPRARTSGPTPVVSSRKWLPLGALAVAAALVLAVSRWVLVEQSEQRIEDARPSEAVHQLAPQPDEGVAAPLQRSTASTSPQTQPEASEEIVEVASTREEPKVSRPSTSTKARTPQEEGELAIVEQAQRALREQRPDRALELLERHRRMHAHGALAEERELLRAQALCATGRLTEARALAAEFVAEHPASAYAGKMRRVCIQRPSAP